MSMFSLLRKLWMAASEHRSSVFLIITFMGGCFCFLAMSTDSKLEHTIVGDAMRNGPETRIAFAASISLAIPVFANLLVDFYLDNIGIAAKTTTKSTSSNSKDILTKPEKLIFMLGIVLPPIVSCFSGWNKATLLFTCAMAMQQQFVFGVMMTSLNRFDANYFPTSLAYFQILVVTAASIVKPYAFNISAAMSLIFGNKLPSYAFQLYGSWCSICMLFFLVTFWLSSVLVARVCGEKVKSQYYRWPSWCYLHHYVQSMKTTTATTTKTQKNISSGGPSDGVFLYFRITYCLTIMTWMLLTGSIHVGHIFYQFDDNELMLYIVPFVIFQLSVLFFDIRLVKHESISALLALIEAKKTYVRYISHELRTPLSAANAGLQMLQEELTSTASTNPVDEERLDTLNDVCSAIATTVDILNDLLMFEKMER